MRGRFGFIPPVRFRGILPDLQLLRILRLGVGMISEQLRLFAEDGGEGPFERRAFLQTPTPKLPRAIRRLARTTLA